MVVTVGIDVHEQTHCAVAVDEAGRQVGKPLTVRATDAGHRQLLRWASGQVADAVLFAVEDCRHVSTRLERALLDAGASVVRVPPKLMAPAPAPAPGASPIRSTRWPSPGPRCASPTCRGPSTPMSPASSSC